MVLVNDEEFITYELDTQQSILIRIASGMDTLPKYLYFPEGLPDNILTAENIRVENLLQEIKDNARDSVDFGALLNSLRDKIPAEMNIEKDVLYPWLAYNRDLERMYNVGPIILKQEAKTFVDAGYFGDEDEFIRFWKTSRDRVKYDLTTAIESNKRENEDIEKLYNTFQEIDEDDALAYTEFVTDRVTIEFSLELHDITLLEIFNHLVMNEAVPFATCKDYFKILKDFIPPEEWAESVEDHLLLKVNSKRKISESKLKDYIDVQVKVEGDIGEEQVIAAMKINTIPGNLKRDEFIQRFLSIFQGLGNVSYTNVKETGVSGNFYFPAERINTYVFSDLVMNNQLFSSLINIDESNKATKKDTASGQPWLHIIFNHPNTGRISAGFTQKQVNRSDKNLRETDPEIFVHGTPYISVRVLRGYDRKAVEIFQLMLSKLLVIYGQQYNEIVEFYERFIPDFGVVEELEVVSQKSKPELIAPNIFVKKYSRNCAPPERIPTILVSERKAKKYESKGIQIMPFPRPEQAKEPHYPSDGERQLYYVCKNPEYPFPGLQKNKLENADIYPYVPCCFKTDQRERAGNYREYYLNEFAEPVEKRQQGLITTNKILNADQYGVLSKDLEKMFSTIENEPNHRFVRVGVHRNHSSFLNAVMVALHDQTGILDLTNDDEREAYLVNTRNKLASPDVAMLASQCCYDMTLDQIQKEISDPVIYLDPKKYIQLLEGYFKCNIYLFNSERMFLPHYIQSYYKNKNSAPCIFVYEHMGSESDHAKYPQCELIIRWNIKRSDDTQFILDFDNSVSKTVNKIFKLMRQSFALDRQIVETVLPWNDDIRIEGQSVDGYGKTRRIDVRYEDQRVTLITSPIPQQAIKENKEKRIALVNGKFAMKVLKKLKATIVSQTINKGIAKELNSTLGTVFITIPIIDQAPFDGIPISESGMHYPESNQSDINIYNQNKKLARYITEYVFWVFSNYIQQKGKAVDITNKFLAKFAKKMFKIVPAFQYGPVPKIFSTSSTIMDGGKIVVTSEDMLKRLMYVLKLYIIRDLRSLINYHTRNVITHYYMDITDFSHNPRQVILHGDDAVDKWIQENRFTYTLHDKIINGQRSPYFFRNKLVENRVFLAQNANSLAQALSVAMTWQRKGYNPGMDVKKASSNYNFTLYSYVNENDISVRDVVGKKNPRNTIRILGYKLGGKPYYTTLLEI
uniref:Uncharacterized protein n=1 Tax=viral metagenome TaxID=1070528 RepID=A0A6C0ELC1_9ZZZZ